MHRSEDGNTTIELSSSSFSTDNTRSESESSNDGNNSDSTPVNPRIKCSRFKKGIYSSPLIKKDHIIKDMISSIEKYNEAREDELVKIRESELEEERREETPKVAKRRKLSVEKVEDEGEEEEDQSTDDLALRVNCILKFSGTGPDVQPEVFAVFGIDFINRSAYLSASDQVLALRFQLVDEAKKYYFEVRNQMVNGREALRMLREKFVALPGSLDTEAKFRIMSGFKKSPSKHPISEMFWYDSRLAYKDLIGNQVIKEKEYLDFTIYKLRPYTLRNYVTSRNPTTDKEARGYCIEFEEKKQKQKKGEKAPI